MNDIKGKTSKTTFITRQVELSCAVSAAVAVVETSP